MTSTQDLRARVRAIVTVAFDAVPAVWPIGGFVATNPLSGLEDRPFAEAIRITRAATGARGFLGDTYYRERFADGQISRAALESSFDRFEVNTCENVQMIFGRRVTARELQWLALTTDLTVRLRREGLDVAADARLRPKPTPLNLVSSEGSTTEHDAVLTLAELLDARNETGLVKIINDQTIRWCAAFLDEGQAAWSMPARDAGFYATWRRLAPYDRSGTTRQISSYASRIADVLPTAEDGIAAALATMDISRNSWSAYLARHVQQLPGWAGIVKWRASNPNHEAHHIAPIDAVQYLAVRLWYEAALVTSCSERHGLEPTATAIRKRFPSVTHVDRETDSAHVLANVAAALGLRETEVLALSDENLRWLVTTATSLDATERGLLWLRAHERTVRKTMLRAIAAKPEPTWRAACADVVFCIDVRSEGLRRHLESLGSYRTRGFAGFYGLPIALRSIDSNWSQSACPVLLVPRHHIIERVAGAPQLARKYRAARTCVAELGQLLDALKGSLASPFALFESIGAFFALPLAARTLLPNVFNRVRERLTRAVVPLVKTQFIITKGRDAPDVGFTLSERIFYAEAALSLMAMRTGFARIVMLVGHGSTTENNPLEASLDCGACAGYRGGPNARILAAILNDVAVRTGLAERGIPIPQTTMFVGAEHDTATDQVRIDDADLVPVSHHGDLHALQSDLNTAGSRLAEERMRTLEPPSRQRASIRAQRRSCDWAQVRPEWGLARNAAFIIAPRSFTFGVDLGTRTFMHEYDVDGDGDGALLEIIMTAPLVVAQWINNHYYFATVDNERYGSGNKVLHNVVGGIGVMVGNRGDLRAGLPFQSLADESGWYHEPLRLLTVIMAPRDRVQAVIERNTVLQRLFDNEWIALTVWDPETESYWNYTPLGTWTPEPTDSREADLCHTAAAL